MAAFIPFAVPDITQAEIDEVVDSMRSGWLTAGPKTARFERAFVEFLGGDVEAVAVSSATAGLHLALEALDVGPGDEVIVPVHTFTATAEIVCYLGATPVFVDVEAASLTIDPALVERAITTRTKAVIVVHYGGLACAMGTLTALARRYGLSIIEDAAHALPTTHRGRLVGALDSDATVFSFYATKTVTTGEGGMVTTGSLELARRMRTMRLHGIDRDVFDRYQGTRAAWRYDVVAAGYKYNLTDIAAAMGLQQLARAEAMRQRRAAIAAAYDAAFAQLPLQLPARPAAGDLHAWHLYAVRLTGALAGDRDRFIDRMQAAGIGCSVHYIPLHLHTYWRDTYRLLPSRFPVSTDAFNRLVSLPIYSGMSDEVVERTIEAATTALAPLDSRRHAYA